MLCVSTKSVVLYKLYEFDLIYIDSRSLGPSVVHQYPS